MTTSTISNPTPLTTSLRVPLCFWCDADLIEKSNLHYCGTCRKWFRVTWVTVPRVVATI
jgi:hypothetical protein